MSTHKGAVTMSEHYASGTWQVIEGREDEFVQRWTEFITWSRSTFPAMLTASLLHDSGIPDHYLSISEWTDPLARKSWKETPEFQQRYGACVALCDEAKGSDYDLVVTI
jgi:heme-degrading monooxygenase HmoA